LYKRYIRIGNKLYGPYFYRSIRKDGTVKSSYVTKVNLKSKPKKLKSGIKRHNKKSAKKFFTFGIFLVAIFGLLPFATTSIYTPIAPTDISLFGYSFFTFFDAPIAMFKITSDEELFGLPTPTQDETTQNSEGAEEIIGLPQTPGDNPGSSSQGDELIGLPRPPSDPVESGSGSEDELVGLPIIPVENQTNETEEIVGLPEDEIIRVQADCGAITARSIANGDWSDAATWSGDCTPNAPTQVVILHNVSIVGTGNNASTIGINAGGHLNLLINQTTSLRTTSNFTVDAGGVFTGGANNIWLAGVDIYGLFEAPTGNVSVTTEIAGVAWWTQTGSKLKHNNGMILFDTDYGGSGTTISFTGNSSSNPANITASSGDFVLFAQVLNITGNLLVTTGTSFMADTSGGTTVNPLNVTGNTIVQGTGKINLGFGIVDPNGDHWSYFGGDVTLKNTALFNTSTLNTTIVGHLIIQNTAEFRTNGNVTICERCVDATYGLEMANGNNGTFNAKLSAGNITIGSFYLGSGSTFNATTGTTTLSSRQSGGTTINIQNKGHFDHNNGLVNITQTVGTTLIELRGVDTGQVDGIVFNNLSQNTGSQTTLYNVAGDAGSEPTVTVLGNFNLLGGGIWDTRSGADSNINNNITGTLTIGSSTTFLGENANINAGNINITGTYNATTGTTNITFGNFSNYGIFNHSSGRVFFGGGTGSNQSITGTNEMTFFNLNITNQAVNVTLEQNATIEGVLNIDSLAGLVLDATDKNVALSFGNDTGGRSTMVLSGGLRFAGNRANHVTIQGRHANHPVIISPINRIIFDSGGSGSVVNLKWLDLVDNGANIINTGGGGVTLNITGNVSRRSWLLVISAGDTFNATQPDTNISARGGAVDDIQWLGPTNIIGGMGKPILISKFDGIEFRDAGPYFMQYVTIDSGGATGGTAFLIAATNPIITKIDNITVINSNRAIRGPFGIVEIKKDILVTNSTFASESTLVPYHPSAQQIHIDDSNFTCIRCNFTNRIGYYGDAGEFGYILSINATDPVTGVQTNNIDFWGNAHAKSFNATLGAQPANWSSSANLTLRNIQSWTGNYLFNTTLIFEENVTIANITLTNYTVMNISAGNGTTLTNNLNVNGTLTIGKNANLTVMGTATISPLGYVNSKEGNTPISFGSLILNNGTYNATAGVTTLTSENSDGRALDNLGTIIHNSGLFNITATSNATINTGKDSLFNLQIAAPLGNITLLNDTDLIGGLNITNGTLDTNTSFGHGLTSNNLVILDGTLHTRNSSNISLSALTINSAGAYNATLSTTNITNGNWTNSGSFTHNAGRVFLGGGTNENQTIGGNNETTFFNLNITNGVVAVTQEQNTTVEGVLDIAAGSSYIFDATDKVLAATFGNASGGNTKIINSGTLGFAGNRINFVKIIGARGQNPITISGTDWDWDSGGSGSAVNISNVDYQIDATTGGGGVTVILDGTSVNLNDFILTAGDSLNATKSGLIITIGNVTADQLTIRGTINLDSVIINSYYALLFNNANAIININNISVKSAADYGIQIANINRIIQLNNSIFRSGDPYAGMYIQLSGKTITGTNNTFVGIANSNNVYGQDIYLNDGAKAELTNSTFTTVGFIGPTGYLISKDHNKVTNNWTIWGMLDTTTGNSTGGYNGTNWTASDSINLALATRYTNYFPSNLNATNNFVVGGMNISNGTNLIGSNYNLSLGSLYIISGGLYNATTGTTTLTSENPDGRALDNLGTITHNSGRVNITATSNVTINTGKDSLFNLQIAAPLGNITLLNDTDLIGGLNITTGTLDTNTSFGHRLTATNAVIITGTLHGRNSSNITLGGVIISSTGIFNATTETMLLTKEITSNGMPFDNDGIFTANNGTINITNSIGDDTSFDLLGLNNGNIWNLNILNTFSNYYGSNGGQIDNNFYANNANFRASSVGAVSDFNVTGNLRLENSAGWGNNGDTGNQRFGSITILSTANIRATAGTTTLTSENTEGIVLDNRGTITHNSGLFNITTTTNTTINTGANSLFNLQIAAPLGNVTLLNNIDLVGGLNITNGTLDTNTSFGYRLSSASPAVISGTLNGRNSSNITLAALTINSAGTYNATSNITTLSSEDPLSRTLDNLGTIVHNSGLFNITGTTGVTINTGKDSLFNLQIATGAGNVTLLNDTDLIGGLNITTGTLDTNTSFGHGLTSNNLVILDGTLHTRNSSNISLSALTINSAGTYNATLSTTNITNGNWTNGGSFTHNAGRVIFGSGTGTNQSITGTNETTFFNLNITNQVVNVTLEQNATVEGVLGVAAGSTLDLDATDKQLYLTFGNNSGGFTGAVITGTIHFSGNKVNPVTIRGANAMHQPQLKRAAAGSIDFDSGGSGSIVNLKWLHFNSSLAIITDGGGVTLNITGNISNNGAISLTAGDTLNITQPDTNISGFDNTANSYTIRGTFNVLGSASQPILFWENDEWLLDNGSILNIQYATFSASANVAGAAVIIEEAPLIIKIDNITVNSTNRSEVGGGIMFRNLEKDVLITNSTFAGEAPLHINPKRGLAQQVIVDESNFTCIRCNFSLVGWNAASQGWVLSVNATDSVTGSQTNNTHFWGVGRTSEFNTTLGVNTASWTKHTNLTIHDEDGRTPGTFINATLVVSENFTVTNITVTNNTFINISSNNAVNTIGYLFVNGTINLEKDASLNVSQDLILYGVGFLNSREGSNPITLGSLTINSGGIYNATSGTTKIISENADGLAIDNDGTWTHNSGRVNITISANTTIDLAGTGGSLYDLEISLLNGTNATLLSDASIAGGLNITGILNTNLTFGYNLTSAGDAYIKSGGRLDAINSTNITFNSLTIEPGGTYNATLYNTSLRGEPAEGRIFNCDGELIANNGIINLASTGTATNVDGLCDSGNIFDLLVTGDAINSDDSFTIDHDLNITFDDFDINGWTLLILGSVNIENSGLLELNANPLNVLGNVLVRDTQSRIWPSTTGRLNVTGTYNVSGSGGLRNANNVGAIYIGRTGSISAGGGDLNITSGNFTNDGSFNHNSSSVIFGGGTNNNQTIGGNNETRFFNLNITNQAVNVTLEQNTTVEGVLNIGSLAGLVLDATDKTLIVTFGNASGGNTKIINSGTLGFAGNRINFVKIIGASAGHPVKVNGTDWDWDSGGLDSVINLGNLDFQAAATTGGGGVRLNVSAGNVSFASLALNNQDQLNISNASNVTLTNSGSITLNGKINIVNGLLFNASYNNTIFSVNGSNILISDVATIPAPSPANTTGNVNISTISRFLNITNLTTASIIDLNFTYNLTSVSALNETNLSIQKYNDSDSRWHNLSAARVDTANKVIFIEDFTQVGSVFAPAILLSQNVTAETVSSEPGQQNKDQTYTTAGGGGGGLLVLPGANLDVFPREITLTLAPNLPEVQTLTLTNNENSPIEVNVEGNLPNVHVSVATSAPNIIFDSSNIAEAQIITLQPSEKITMEVTFLGETKGTFTGKLIITWNVVDNLARSSTEIPVILEIESFKRVIDIALNIPSVFKNILKSGTLTYQVNLINSGDYAEAQDITVNYFIKDFSGKKYYEDSEIVSITRQKVLIKSIKLPELTPGTYVLIAELTHNGEFATASSTFNILGDIKSLLKEESFIKTVIAISLLFAISLLALHMFKLRSRKQQLKLPRRLFK